MSQDKVPGKAQQNHTPQTGQEHGRVHQVQEREQHAKDHLGHETHRAHVVSPNEHRNTDTKEHAAPPATGITIYIDHKPVHTASETFSGVDLRKLVTPPIGPDKSIFRVVSGKGDDIKVEDTDMITVDLRVANKGRHFFSDTIVPTKDAIARKAYAIYLEEGSQPGHEAEHWAKAEAQCAPHDKK